MSDVAVVDSSRSALRGKLGVETQPAGTDGTDGTDGAAEGSLTR
jgi:hypothetical protein